MNETIGSFILQHVSEVLQENGIDQSLNWMFSERIDSKENPELQDSKNKTKKVRKGWQVSVEQETEFRRREEYEIMTSSKIAQIGAVVADYCKTTRTKSELLSLHYETIAVQHYEVFADKTDVFQLIIDFVERRK